MAKAPSKQKHEKFPLIFQRNGRIGRIKKWAGKFATYFRFNQKAYRNTFASFEAAVLYLENEFLKLDSDRANSLTLNPLNGDVKGYSELEQLLREQGGGASLREAVSFYLAHHVGKKFAPLDAAKCAEKFIASQTADNVSPAQIKTLEKHFRRFLSDFGRRKIHEIQAGEVADWIASRKVESTGEGWSAKTRTSVLGSLVSLSIYSRDILCAIPDIGKTEFQKVRRPKKDAKGEVEIYTAQELKALLYGAFEFDLELIPPIVIGGLQGMRPAEIHAEGAKRPPLSWDAFIWNDGILHITGQKVRSKSNRDVKIHDATIEWLRPFRDLKGLVWRHSHAYTKKMEALRKRTGVRSIYDGLRHSYASYRFRQLKDLSQLAEEMGNSPREIIASYKKNVTDGMAKEWFSIMPPPDYCEQVRAVLKLRQAPST
jgi:integrase